MNDTRNTTPAFAIGGVNPPGPTEFTLKQIEWINRQIFRALDIPANIAIPVRTFDRARDAVAELLALQGDHADPALIGLQHELTDLDPERLPLP